MLGDLASGAPHTPTCKQLVRKPIHISICGGASNHNRMAGGLSLRNLPCLTGGAPKGDSSMECVMEVSGVSAHVCVWLQFCWPVRLPIAQSFSSSGNVLLFGRLSASLLRVLPVRVPACLLLCLDTPPQPYLYACLLASG